MMFPAATPATTAFLSGSAGTGEWLLLFGVILVLFGPRRLPEIARTVGRWMMEARRAANEFRDQVMSIDVPADEPPADVSKPPVPARPGAAGAVHRGADGDEPVQPPPAADRTPDKPSTSGAPPLP